MGRPKKDRGGEPPRGKTLVTAGAERGQIVAPEPGMMDIVRGGAGRAGGIRDVVVGRTGPRYEYVDGVEWAVLPFGKRVKAPQFPPATPEVVAAAPDRFAKHMGEPSAMFSVEQGEVIMQLAETSTWTGLSLALGLHKTALRQLYQSFEQKKLPAEEMPYWTWLFRGIGIAAARRQLLMEGTIERAAEQGDWKAAERLLSVIAPDEWAPPSKVQIEHSKAASGADVLAQKLDELIAAGASIDQLEALAGLLTGAPEKVDVRSGPPEP